MNVKTTFQLPVFLALLFCLVTGPAIAQSPANNILYVNQDVPAGGDGSGDSWANALPELADALRWAREQHDNNTASWGENNPLQVWVATGTYKPQYSAADGQYTTDGGRDNAFVMVPNVQLYGGFTGNETDITARDWVNNPTTLSGDLGTPGDNSDNAYHVLISANEVGNALLDGFTVTGGNADGSGTIPVNGQDIWRNEGGGMVNLDSSPVLTNATFSGNSADIGLSGGIGGGMLNVDSSPLLTNVTFSGNSGSSGGGMFNFGSSSPTLTNVTFSGNSSSTNGGGMFNHNSSSPTLTNVTFSGNTSGNDGGGMYNWDSSPTLTNVILWGNQAGGDDASASASIFNSNSTPSISYSLIANSGGSGNWDTDLGDDGGNNMDVDPQFIEPADPEHEDFLRLPAFSPAINAGDPDTDLSIFPGGPENPTDLAGNPRVFDLAGGGVIDIGAYEFQGEPAGQITPTNGVLYVNIDVDETAPDYTGNGSSWANALPELADALKWAREEHDGGSPGWDDENPLRIFVAAGTYLPMYNAEDGSYTSTGGRGNAFVLVPSVQIYGGFDPAGGIETLDNERILPGEGGGTILSGDLGSEDDESDNAYHVVVSAGAVGSAALDGLTLTGGHAFANPGDVITVNEETIHQNRGGGMAIHNSSPALAHILFTANSANEDGGGIFNTNSSPSLTNVTFTGNSAGGGGGMDIHASLNSEGSAPTLTNVLFIENHADEEFGYGGGLNNSGEPIFTNVTFSGNQSATGGGISNTGTLSMTNSIIWGNDAGFYGKEIYNTGTINLYYSLYRDGEEWESIIYDQNDGFTANEHSIVADPQFTDSDNRDYTLLANSRAINMGTNAPFEAGGVAEGITTDLAGNDRIFNNGTVDIGAYEFQGAPLVPATQVTLTEAAGEGWRFMTSPVVGETFENFLAPLWTQGIPGSDNPGANTPNIYRLDQDEYQWVPLSDMQEEIGPGTPFIVWVFEDDNNDGMITPEEEFDKTLTSTGDWLPLDGSFEYSGLDFDSNQEPDGDSHFLLANPHPISLDFCEFAKEQVAEAVWFWDPAAGGGNGDYLDLNCTTDEVHIAPFQAFWVRTLAENPELSIPEEAYLGTAAAGYFKQGTKPSRGLEPLEGLDLLTLSIQSADGVFTNRVRLLLGQESSGDLSRYDTPKLSAAGLAARWLSFHALDEEGRAYAFRSLPALETLGEHPSHDSSRKPSGSAMISPRGEIMIPLDIETTEEGLFELGWTLPDHFRGSAVLRDTYTNHVVELTPGGTYRFEVEDVVEPSRVFETLEGFDPHPATRIQDPREPRFTLTISAAGASNSALPLAVSLLPNYPNPFNPVTQIRFELPQPSRVSLEVYDILGRRVATLVDETMAAGVQTATFDARGLASGVYLTRLQVEESPAGPVVQVHKMTLIRRE